MSKIVKHRQIFSAEFKFLFGLVLVLLGILGDALVLDGEFRDSPMGVFCFFLSLTISIVGVLTAANSAES